MRFGIACLAASAAIIAATWAWLGQPIAMPNAPLGAGEKLWCVSYAPFRGQQTPFNPSLNVPAAQIEEDLTRLAALTDCIRIYAVNQGLDQVAPIAARLGLKVLQGAWLSTDSVRNKAEIETAVALANRYPDTIRAVVVGNEVLLRGEMTATDLAANIRAVKAQVKVPVTYADVWEFWLRNRDVAAAADFITIHILPYWEDFPIPAKHAAPHVDQIRREMVAAFAGKEVIVGEVGWPSAGRMREGALPSPANQARVIQDVLALAKRDGAKVNVIEAFDQPWKRALEGTVGGHWGLFEDSRSAKFGWGEAVSNHPLWIWQAAGGIAFTVLVFGAAFRARGQRDVPVSAWLAVAGSALAGGLLLGMTVARLPVESLGPGGWLRSLAFLMVAVLSPLAVSAAVMRGLPLPRFSRLLGPAAERSRDPLVWLVGSVMIFTLLLALVVALSLVFDPRYRDFPFAPLTAAVVPFVLHSLTMPRPAGGRGAAELGGAALLALTVPYIVLNETLANWQSLWVCAGLLALAFSLAQVRDVRS
ncbi:MAG: glycosyl hydrolase family 17 protein [Pseudolabrys sp.]|nr:glycosyl hydrolase family 17 protein [Pseudolabrys sp.]